MYVVWFPYDITSLKMGKDQLLMMIMQALNFALEGAQQFSPGKRHFYSMRKM